MKLHPTRLHSARQEPHVLTHSKASSAELALTMALSCLHRKRSNLSGLLAFPLERRISARIASPTASEMALLGGVPVVQEGEVAHVVDADRIHAPPHEEVLASCAVDAARAPSSFDMARVQPNKCRSASRAHSCEAATRRHAGTDDKPSGRASLVSTLAQPPIWSQISPMVGRKGRWWEKPTSSALRPPV